MPEALEGSWHKIRRAVKELHALGNEINTFMKTPPYEPILKEDERTGEQLLVLRVSRETDPEWGVRIGELLHNYRSALDTAVWELVRLNQKHATNLTAYPITATLTSWDTGRHPQQDRIAGVHPLAFAIILASQPFQARDHGLDPRWSALSVLSRLSNIDKHKVLHTTAVATDIPEMEFRSSDGLVLASSPAMPGRTVNKETVIARWKINSGASGYVYMNGVIATHIAFDESVRSRVTAVERRDVIALMSDINLAVVDLMYTLQMVAFLHMEGHLPPSI